MEELIQKNKPGHYLLHVYVIEKRDCPVCKPPIHCKNCQGPKIYLHETPTPPHGATLPLVVKEAQFEQVEVGQRYRIEIYAEPTDYKPRRINRIEVLSITR